MAAERAHRGRASVPPLAAPATAPSAAPATPAAPSSEPTARTTVSLSPKDIQKRIRSGQSPEQVATAMGSTVERIRIFTEPILAERAHVAERAQRASLRREHPGPRVLGEAVVAKLDRHELGPEIVEWDSYRQYDGRWHVTAVFSTPWISGTAEFTYDVEGNFVTVDNDRATWLVDDLPPAAAPTPATPAKDDLFAARIRRQTVVEVTETVVETPLEAYLPEPVEAVEAVEVITAAESVEVAVAEPVEAPRPAKRKRSSVPSWDDIMFGTK